MHLQPYTRLLLTILALLGMSSLSQAQAPANDSLCNAVALTVGGTCNGTTNGDNTNATLETDEPLPFCAFAGQASTVWFSFVAPVSGLVDITTDFPVGNIFDSQMGLFSLPNGDCTDMLDLVEEACDQNGGSIAFGGSMAEMRQVPVVPGETYYIQVDGIGGFIQGAFCIEVYEATPLPPTINDTLCHAILLNANDTCMNLYNFFGLTNETGEPNGSCSFTTGEFTAWFKFVGPPSGAAIVTLNLPFPAGTLTEVNMAIYTMFVGGDCTTPSFLSEYACSVWDYPFLGGYDLLPTIGTTFTPGDTFYVQLSGTQDFFNYNPTEGTFCIEVQEVSLPANDDPCNALPLTTDGVIQEFSNIGATVDPLENSIAPPPGDPNTDGSEGQWAAGLNFIEHSVWFTFVAPPTGNVQIDLTTPANLARLNTQVAVYQTTDCSDFSTYVRQGANDDAFFSPLSQLNQYCLTPGETYYILVDGASGFLQDEGNFLIRILEIFSSPLQLSFLTKDPSCPGATDGSALIVDPSGGSGSYTYSWSTGDTTQEVIGGLGAGPIMVNVSDDCDSALVESFTLANPPTLGIHAGPDQIICEGDSVMIGANPLQTGGTPGASERFYMIDLVGNANEYGINVHKQNFPEIRTNVFDQIDFGDYSLTFDPNGNILYLLNRFSNLLQQYDVQGGFMEDLGTISPVNTDQFWTGMAYDEVGNKLYACAGEGPANQSYLYEVTPVINSSTVSLSTTMQIDAPVWLAVDSFGVMFTADFFSDSLFIVDQTNGQSLGVGLLNMDANLFSDADFDPTTNQLYVSSTEDLNSWTFYEVDPLLAEATAIFPYLGAEFAGALAIAPETLPAYSYLWGPAPGLSSTVVPDPIAFPSFTTTYFANVTDGCGTTVVDTVVVTVASPAALALSSTPDNGTSNGSASAALTGGTPPFIYAWSNGEDSSSIAGLDSGVYAVTITDSVGCVLMDSIEVSSNVSLDDLRNAGMQSLEVFPNPTSSQLTVRAQMASNTQVSLRLTDLRGKVLYNSWPQQGFTFEQSLDLSGFSPGIYLLSVQTDRGQVQQRIVLH